MAMTVKELITWLSDLDQDAVVKICVEGDLDAIVENDGVVTLIGDEEDEE